MAYGGYIGELRRHLACKGRQRESCAAVTHVLSSSFLFVAVSSWVFCFFLSWSSYIFTAAATDSFHMNDFRVYWLGLLYIFLNCAAATSWKRTMSIVKKRHFSYYFLFILLPYGFDALFPARNRERNKIYVVHCSSAVGTLKGNLFAVPQGGGRGMD